ncbi:MAG: DUF523 domain-containing protein [Thermodesulfobacteriota bacterium]
MNRRILISGCLAGLRVRYDGNARPHPLLQELARNAVLVPCCPEILGGLGVPRPRCRFVGGDGRAVLKGAARIIDSAGNDRTDAFLRGAEEVMKVCRLIRPDLVIFKEGSPSCGVRRVDIEGTKQEGCGVTTAMLESLTARIITEEDSVPARLVPGRQ